MPFLKVRNIGFDYFSSVMGLAGRGLVWRSAAQYLDGPLPVGEGILGLALLVFIALISIQIVRAIFTPWELAAEWNDLARRNFFCTATIASALLSLGLLTYNRYAAEALWGLGVSAQLIFLVFMIRHWFIEKVDHSELSPAWLIPMVGNASPSFAGVSLGYGPVCKVLLATSIFCWAAFMPLILYRIIFVNPKIPDRSMPGLAILVSAPAVLSVSIYSFTQSANDVVQILSWTSLFFAVVILSLGKRLIAAPFSRSWWAFTFPSTALASSLIRVYDSIPNQFNHYLAVIALYSCSVIAVYVASAALLVGLNSIRSQACLAKEKL
ncbi:SLAC1 family transporter [Pseudomonas caricapapayae]|uniref:SLAC1 family transporter n=1 Tax=Pseudomonas caricapapayae TaxID=46678 RepID=UPI0011C4229A|nr:C4-dicarboxylate transporter [Pseudomonas caricapapayae]